MTYFRFPGDDESRYETRADAEADFRFFSDREPEQGEIEEAGYCESCGYQVALNAEGLCGECEPESQVPA